MKKHKKNILFLIPKAEHGGTQRQLSNLLKYMRRDRYDISLGYLYDSDTEEHLFSAVHDLRTVSFHKKGPYDLGVYLRIARFLRSHSIDIIQSFLGNHHACIPCLFAPHCLPVGGIRSTRSQHYSLVRWWLTVALSSLFIHRKSFSLISNSESGKALFVRHGYPARAITVIPNGIDYRYFSSGNRKKIVDEFALENSLVLGIVARLVPSKNHEALIDMFSELSANTPALRMLIVGDGPLMSRLVAKVQRMNLSDTIIFTGNRKDIPDFLAAMDIFVFPSEQEAWPNVVGEAMAAGLPVVSYEVGDVKRIITNDRTGIVTKPQMVLFTEQVKRLISDKGLRIMLGKKARAFIQEHCSIEHMVREYEAFYEGLP